MTPDTIEPYSFQKLSCEIACKTWAKCYDLKTVVFRFFKFMEKTREKTQQYQNLYNQN